MVDQQVLEAAVARLQVDDQSQITLTDAAAAQAEQLILDFAIKDTANLRERNMHLIGLRLQDVLCGLDASAAHINAAMKWLQHTDPGKSTSEDTDPIQAPSRMPGWRWLPAATRPAKTLHPAREQRRLPRRMALLNRHDPAASATSNKESRIIDILEPLTGQHRVVVSAVVASSTSTRASRGRGAVCGTRTN